jgi:hypothetical protein
LRGSQLTCFGGGKQVEARSGTSYRYSGREYDQPDRHFAADPSAREFYCRGAQAETALLRKSAKYCTNNRATEQERQVVAEPVSKQYKIHDATPLGLRTPDLCERALTWVKTKVNIQINLYGREIMVSLDLTRRTLLQTGMAAAATAMLPAALQVRPMHLRSEMLF